MQDVSIGRVLDLLAERFKVTNENNRTDTQLEVSRVAMGTDGYLAVLMGMLPRSRCAW